MVNTATQSKPIELDPLGLSVDDWANIAKTATLEAIKSAHAEGLSTVGASPDGKLYRTMLDGTVVPNSMVTLIWRFYEHY
jgi:hypothetical protein